MNKTNIIKLFEDKKKLKSKEIIFIKNYTCKAIIGYHAFEKIKPQKLRFNVEILSKQKRVIDGNINSVLNYEEIINKINLIIKCAIIKIAPFDSKTLTLINKIIQIS